MKTSEAKDDGSPLISDACLVWDIFSISYDGGYANAKVQGRVANTVEQHVFQMVANQYLALSEKLLVCLGELPKDSGSMNPEAGYIGKAYLHAIKASDKNLPNRIMSINRQALKRIKRLVTKLKDRLFALRISEFLASIQMTLDQVSHRRQQAGLVCG
ncbi:hypothetical protein [Marinomonas spartinae]|uniref:hypothetical protein n=1 Tax=Marinomonas spartinae TaxID=1792290 RepID=UPI0018F139E5|nr:hypothetical protein [Marinomonas spartinae]MBJ7554423.1 hypothetical protein [Marinomonas spartinae]